jgi:tetratricopeptide (TPR) repeat protein
MPSGAIRCLQVLALFWIGAAQPAEVPQSTSEPQSQGQLPASEAARQWYLLGDAADRAGNKQEAMRDYEESIKAYQQAISRNPGHASLWRNLGFVYRVSDQNDLAIAAYGEAIRLRPDDAESHAMLGNLQSSDPDTAISEYRQAVRLKPSEAKYHLDLGLALARQSEFTSAVAEIQEAARLDPKSGEIHLAWGEVLQNQGDVSGAISEYRKALTLELTSLSDSRVRGLLRDALAREGKGNSTDSDYWIKKLEEWREAVARHKPGESDAAAVLIGSWSLKDLWITVGLIKKSTGRPLEDNLLKQEIPKLSGISRSLRLGDDPDRILKRGALLHTDIALLQLGTGVNDSYGPTVMSMIKDGRATLTSHSPTL